MCHFRIALVLLTFFGTTLHAEVPDIRCYDWRDAAELAYHYQYGPTTFQALLKARLDANRCWYGPGNRGSIATTHPVQTQL